MALKSTFLTLGPPNLAFWYKMGQLFTCFWNLKKNENWPFFNFWPYLAFSDFCAPRGPRKSDYAQISLKIFLFFQDIQKSLAKREKKTWACSQNEVFFFNIKTQSINTWNRTERENWQHTIAPAPVQNWKIPG